MESDSSSEEERRRKKRRGSRIERNIRVEGLARTRLRDAAPKHSDSHNIITLSFEALIASTKKGGSP